MNLLKWWNSLRLEIQWRIILILLVMVAVLAMVFHTRDDAIGAINSNDPVPVEDQQPTKPSAAHVAGGLDLGNATVVSLQDSGLPADFVYLKPVDEWTADDYCTAVTASESEKDKALQREWLKKRARFVTIGEWKRHQHQPQVYPCQGNLADRSQKPLGSAQLLREYKAIMKKGHLSVADLYGLYQHKPGKRHKEKFNLSEQGKRTTRLP